MELFMGLFTETTTGARHALEEVCPKAMLSYYTTRAKLGGGNGVARGKYSDLMSDLVSRKFKGAQPKAKAAEIILVTNNFLSLRL
jgi:hypothetical protein